MHIRDVQYSYEEYLYRTPIKFGGVAVDRATVLNVAIDCEDAAGKQVVGLGSMPLGNVWAFPSRRMGYDSTLLAMKQVVSCISEVFKGYGERRHPLWMHQDLEPLFLECGNQVSMGLEEGVPALAVLVCASPFDAALHDAFGKLLGLNSFQTLTPEFVPEYLDAFLGKKFAGRHVSEGIEKRPSKRMPLYHLVGALDALTEADVTKPVGDGHPETLREWIRQDGLTHLKIKLNGDDLNWDLERVRAVDRVASETRDGHWQYSLDFNERCQNVEYLLEFLRQLQTSSVLAYERVQYIEQPTARDLKNHLQNRMHAAAKLKPVVIDESLVDLESLELARELGYTGVALKACKGQSGSLLMAAAAQHYGLFLCVQDLTCPGASLVHSAGLAAHVQGVAAIEANARQYLPAANVAWKQRMPGLFTVKDGAIETGCLDGVGLALGETL